MNCIECEKIKQKKNLIYEDNSVIALLNDKPATGGHIILYPKQHYTIIEQMPDELAEHMLIIANKLSIALFDAIGAHGTNILVQNGVAAGQKTTHTSMHIIPRVENDGLNLHWTTIKMSEEDLSTAQVLLKDEIENPKEPKKTVKEEIKEEEIMDDEDNYMLKQLERTP